MDYHKTGRVIADRRQELGLTQKQLADEEINGLFSAPDAADPPLHELDPGAVDAGALRIDGQDVHVLGIYVRGQVVSVDYSTVDLWSSAPPPSTRRCILTIFQNGTVRKTSALYENGVAACIVDNTDNTDFTLHREHRDLFYFLHGYE